MKSRYLRLTPLEEARQILLGISSVPKGNTSIPVEDSAGWITAIPVQARYCIPLTDVAAMDGYVVHASDTVGAAEQCPVFVRDSVRIHTGGVIPKGYDAVIMSEECWEDEGGIVVRKPSYPGQHIRRAGEDVKEGQVVLPPGHQIRPEEVGALASYGVSRVVVRTCSVGIIPTGGEVIEPGTALSAGQVIDGNTRMAMAYMSARGVHCTRYPICPDNPESLSEMVDVASDIHDLVIISAGSSTGSRDYAASVLRNLGSVSFHGVAVKPGKTVLAGKIRDAVVLGLPGYPLSAQVVMRELVLPLLISWGFSFPDTTSVRAELVRTAVSEPGIQEFIPVTTATIGKRRVAVPQPGGAAVQMASIRSNGLLVVSSDIEGIEAGEEISVQLTADPRTVDQTLLLAGPRTPLTDLLLCSYRWCGLYLVSVRSDVQDAITSVLQGIYHAALVPGGDLPLPSDSGLTRTLVCRVPYGLACRTGEERMLKDPDSLAVNLRGFHGREVYASHRKAEDGQAGPVRQTEFTDESFVVEAVVSAACSAGTLSYPVARSKGLAFSPLGEVPVFLYTVPDMDDRLIPLIQFLHSETWKEQARAAGYETG